MVALASQYWGQSMTVTGLLTGQDIFHALKERALGDAVLLPSLMLKHNDTRFLDDMTVAELSHQLQTRILVIGDVEHLVETVGKQG